MKKLKLLLLLPVFVILVSGCTMEGGTEQAQEILESAVNKSVSISSCTASYNTDMDMNVMGQSIMGMEGVLGLWKKLDKSKMSGTLTVNAINPLTGQMLQEQMSLSLYYLPDGIYICTDEDASCMQTEETGLPMDITSPDESLEQLRGMVGQGVVTLSYLGTKLVAGRTCDNIKAVLDVSQITDMEEIADISEELVAGIQEAMQNANIYYTLCLDQETGHALEYAMSLSMSMQMSAEQTGGMGPMTLTLNMDMQMTATSFNPNVVVADSEFVLPYSLQGF